MAYHLVIGIVEQDVNPKTDIYYDRIFKGVEIKVREYDLIEFNSNRKAIVDEIVYLLTNGTQPPKITDNKHYMNMNKQVIRLTEGDLHKIIKESVNEILDDPYDYAKVNGLSAAAFKAARTPGADPKWAERKMRQSDMLKDRSKKLRSEFSKMNDENDYVDYAMSGVVNHRVKQGLDDPKGYIRRNGYGNYLKGVAESDLHRIVKESVDRILKEYTGDFGYSDDPNYNKFAQQNRPQQKQTPPLANYQPKRLGGNLVSNDGGESYMWDDSQQRQFGNNGTVEESTVNEVMYNGRSYHGNNADDWADLADKRETRQFNLDPNVGTKVGKMNAQDMLNHAKNGVDFSKLTIDDRIDSKGNVHKDMNNMTPEEWRQWTKNGAARLRNWGNYHATRSDYTPNKRKEYSQEDYQKARGWNDYRNRGFNSALQQWNS